MANDGDKKIGGVAGFDEVDDLTNSKSKFSEKPIKIEQDSNMGNVKGFTEDNVLTTAPKKSPYKNKDNEKLKQVKLNVKKRLDEEAMAEESYISKNWVNIKVTILFIIFFGMLIYYFFFFDLRNDGDAKEIFFSMLNFAGYAGFSAVIGFIIKQVFMN